MSLLVVLTVAPLLAGGEIAERLARPVDATLNSSKGLEEIELCVADATSVRGALPLVYRSGANKTLILNGPNIISLVRVEAGTKIELRARNNNDKRIAEDISVCL